MYIQKLLLGSLLSSALTTGTLSAQKITTEKSLTNILTVKKKDVALHSKEKVFFLGLESLPLVEEIFSQSRKKIIEIHLILDSSYQIIQKNGKIIISTPDILSDSENLIFMSLGRGNLGQTLLDYFSSDSILIDENQEFIFCGESISYGELKNFFDHSFSLCSFSMIFGNVRDMRDLYVDLSVSLYQHHFDEKFSHLTYSTIYEIFDKYASRELNSRLESLFFEYQDDLLYIENTPISELDLSAIKTNILDFPYYDQLISDIPHIEDLIHQITQQNILNQSSLLMIYKSMFLLRIKNDIAEEFFQQLSPSQDKKIVDYYLHLCKKVFSTVLSK